MSNEKDKEIIKQEKKLQHIEKLKERQKEASIARKIVLICVVIIILTIVGAGYGLYKYVINAIGPVDENDHTPIEVSIPIGSSSDDIGQILEESGVIRNADIFKYYIRFKNEDGFQAGDYELTKSMDLDEIIQEIKSGRVYEEFQTTFIIPEGRWIDSVFEIIAENSNLTEDDLFEVMEDEEFLDELIEQYEILDEVILDEDIRWPLEGYLFPSRYDFVEEELEAKEVIRTMLDRMTEVLMNNGAAESELTYHEILTIASIIEGEARNDEEREMIAGVIYNRLHPSVNMPLQMDPTVAYAHGEHLPRTLNEHLEIESPYNTYYVTGLPVGPINNPGEASIRAALHPEVHDYLYFYHSPDGKIHFSKTLNEHNAILRQYRD